MNKKNEKTKIFGCLVFMLLSSQAMTADYEVNIVKVLGRSDTLEALRRDAINEARIKALKLSPVYYERRVNSTKESLFESAISNQLGIISVSGVNESIVALGDTASVSYAVVISIDEKAFDDFVVASDEMHGIDFDRTKQIEISSFLYGAGIYLDIKYDPVQRWRYRWDGSRWRLKK